MKILILSPIPSHYTTNYDRLYLRDLGVALKNDGHEITFILCDPHEPQVEYLKAMDEFWDNFLHIQVDNKPGCLDKAKISDAVKLLAPADLDLFIVNYAYLYPDFDYLPSTATRICIANMTDSTCGHDILTYKQKYWFGALKHQFQTDLFAKMDMLLTHNDEESRLLENLAMLPVVSPDLQQDARQGDYGDQSQAGMPEIFYKVLNNKKKRILLVTDRQFWDVRHAISSVLIPLFRHLRRYFHLTVYYLGSFSKDDWDKVWELGFYSFVFSSGTASDYHIEHTLDENASFKEAFSRFIIEQPHFDAVIFNFIMIHYLARCIPYKIFKILDTQDIMSVRRFSMERSLTYDMPLAKEAEIYNRFDSTLFIEHSERDFAAHVAPGTISIYCPASYEAIPPPFPAKGVHFGFVGSQWILNSEAIEWFLKEVWPFQNRPDARLHIFGGVCKCLSGMPDNVVLHGIVQSAREMFSYCNVILNPTLRGSGFPTKSLQALAHARPLLATEKGARGLETGVKNGIFAAKNRGEHIDGMLQFSHDTGMRTIYSRNALIYARDYFTSYSCYSDLINIIYMY